MAGKPATCQGCPLFTDGESFVMGEGPSIPSYFLIGEAPGANEAQLGKPFCGGAGRVLNALLSQAGIARTRCYITNIIKCRPPGNNLAPYLPQAAQHCRQYLDKELQQHASIPVILLGDVALRFILGQRSITKHRGCVSSWDNRMVMGTIHPAALMREPKMWSVVVADLEYAKMMTTRHKEEPRYFLLQPTIQDVETWFKLHVEERDAPYFVDIETYGSTLACIGIASNRNNAICVPWWDGERWYWKIEEHGLVATSIIHKFLSNEKIKKVFQNGMFDLNVLEETYGFTVNGWVADTMIMHHTVYSEMKHSLAFLHSVYVREPYYKDMAHAEKDEQEE